MSFATKEQLEELVAYMASKISVPTIGIGGGYAPIGTIISYMGTTAPADYLACDGSVVNIADYPQLATFFETQFGSKNFFGGDGTTTFAVPDLRGEFLRGTGTNSHTNQGSGANVGVHQDGTEHTANYSTAGYVGTIGSSSHTPDDSTDRGKYHDNKWKASNAYYSSVRTDTGAAGASDFSTYTSRPTNTSVLYCIKYREQNTYSTDEQRVGTWIDGKPLYQKTLSGTVSNNGAIAMPSGIDIVSIEGALKESSTAALPLSYYVTSNNWISHWIDYSTSNIKFNMASHSNLEAYVTIRYTKTTD